MEKASDGVSYSAPSVETQYLTISSAQCTRLGVLGSGKSERQVLCGTENGKAFHLSGIVVPESLPDGEEYAEWKDRREASARSGLIRRWASFSMGFFRGRRAPAHCLHRRI